jgi:hypothetical protein
MTAAKMSKGERQLHLMAFLHRNYMVNRQWVTIGEYARFALISRSPYIQSVFAELLDEGMILMQQEPYRATIKYTFALNYEKIEACYPHTKHEMITRVGGWKERPMV